MRRRPFKFATEADVAAAVAANLEAMGFEVWAEIEHIDLIARRGDEIIGVEVKKAFCPKLVAQAMRARSYCGAAYMAFPRVADDATLFVAEAAAERGGVGLIEVLHWGHTHANRPLPDELIIRRRASRSNEAIRRVTRLMVPETKGWTAGGKPGCRVVTDFRLTALRVRDYVTLHPGCTVKEVLAAVPTHWSKHSAPQRLILTTESGGVEGVRLEDRNGLATKLFPLAAIEQR